jgi:ATP adenylyltransferase
VEDAGARFSVHVAAGPDRKWKATGRQREMGVDPFLPPYDDDLFVADVSRTHAVLLNKFNVIENHLLLVTRAFEPQSSTLGEEDFRALWACMAELDGLAFYNSGPTAGASQGHKHLQLVSLAAMGLTRDGARALPVRGRPDPDRPEYVCARASISLSPATEPGAAGAVLAALYRRLLDEAGVTGAAESLSPYNLLMTTDAMAVIPRTQAGWEQGGLNAMGYAGSMLVRNAGDLARLRAVGPLAVLAQCGRRR